MIVCTLRKVGCKIGGLKERLLKKIDERSIVVGVVGLGYVGLPLAVEKAKAGFTTIGFDIQSQKVEMVNRSENYIGDVVSADLERVIQDGLLRATNDFSQVAEADFIAICVPTPLDKYQQPDLSYVKRSCEDIAKYLRTETMVVLESTTYPGTTEETVLPILEKGSGLSCGEDFYLGFSPERVDPGNLLYNTKNTPKVVGAVGRDAVHVISQMYRAVLDGDVKEVSSPAVAEMEKILENTYRNVNIGLVNELAILCHRMGISIWEVIDAAKTKPYGFQAFYPGPGLGGHCIPLDPYYLTWRARKYGFHTTMIEASMTVNDHMADYCVERTSKILNRKKQALNGSRLLLLGVAYKQDIDDCRESPAIRIFKRLIEAGAEVDFFDPFVSSFQHHDQQIDSLPSLTPDSIAAYDVILVTTAHTNVDYAMVSAHAQDIFDTKNALSGISNRDNIELL